MLRLGASLLLLASAASAQTRVRVADGSSCDESLRRELSRLAPASPGEKEAEVRASLSAKPPGWKLRLERAGAEPLERALDARDCAEAAFAAGVVVERYLHELARPRPPPHPPAPVSRPNAVAHPPSSTPPPLTPPAPVTAAVRDTEAIPAPPPVAPDATAKTPPPDASVPETSVSPNTMVVSHDDAAPPPPGQTASQTVAPPSGPLLRLARWELSLHGAGWTPAPSGTRFAFGLEGAVLFEPAWRASLELTGGLPEDNVIVVDGVERGTMTVETFEALLTVGRCIDRQLRPCLSVVGGARIARGSSSGAFLFHQTASVLARPSFGLSLALHFLPWRWLFTGLELMGLYNPVHAEFDLQGLPEDTVTFPTFEALLRLSFGASIEH